MSLTTRPFDIAEMIDTEESQRLFLIEAFESGDPIDITLSVRTFLRAEGALDRTASQTDIPASGLHAVAYGESVPDLSFLAKIAAMVGLRLMFAHAQPVQEAEAA